MQIETENTGKEVVSAMDKARRWCLPSRRCCWKFASRAIINYALEAIINDFLDRHFKRKGRCSIVCTNF